MKKIEKIHYLYFAFVAELLLIFYLRNDMGFILSPILILTAGLFLSVYPVFLIKGIPVSNEDRKSVIRIISNKDKTLNWIVFAGLSLVFIVWSYILFQNNPINIRQSDIIPFIKEVLVKRFLANENVYAPVQFNDYGVVFTPNYLPFQWGPFSIAAILKIDFRWIYVFAFLGAAAYQNFHFQKSKIAKSKLMGLSALPFLIVFSIYLKQPVDVAHSIEILTLSYYFFLATALFIKRNSVKGIALTLPLLSRYSFLFWLPVYFYGLWNDNRKKCIITGLFFLAFISVFFVIPFVIPNPDFLKSFNNIYLQGAIREWSGQSWQHPGDKPFQLFQGMGFASWFYCFYEGTLEEKILALKWVLVGVCFLSMLIPILYHHKVRKIISSELFALLSLKFCLTLFYAFILVPYIYLFWIPLIVSVVIINKVSVEP